MAACRCLARISPAVPVALITIVFRVLYSGEHWKEAREVYWRPSPRCTESAYAAVRKVTRVLKPNERLAQTRKRASAFCW